MPTLEERVSILEQKFATFQKDSTAYMHKTDENLTILLGVVQDHGLDIKRIFKRLDSIDQHLDGMDKRLDGVDKRLDGMDKRLDGVDTKLDQHTAVLDQHTALLKQILERLP